MLSSFIPNVAAADQAFELLWVASCSTRERPPLRQQLILSIRSSAGLPLILEGLTRFISERGYREDATLPRGMTVHLPAELQRPDVQAAIVAALCTAYEVSQERHDPEVGDDAMIFGQHIWKSGAHFLKGQLDQLAGCRADFVNQSLDMQVGRARLRHHKLGDSEQDDPARCFPDHPGPASRLGLEQLELQLVSAGDPAECFGWVIGTYGNPEDGLRRVCLQAVGSERALDGTIAGWQRIVTIYEASATAAAADATAGEQAETVIAPEPVVGLQQGEETRDGRGRR